MTSYKTTVIAILAVALASSACPRPQSNYCADVSDHNCMDRDASLPSAPADAPPVDTPPDMNTSCTSDAECPNEACYLPTNGTGTCVQCTASNSDACTNTTPICGTDHKCRICTTNTECDADACLPSGACAEQKDVAYISQVGSGDCTKDRPCGDLQVVLDTMNLPYIRVSGSLTISNQITINKGVVILGDTGSELAFTTNQESVLKISLNNLSNDPTNDQNAQVVINYLRIRQNTGKDGVQILGKNPIVKLTHVSIDGGSGNGISTSDNDSKDPTSPAMNPNIILTDVAIRQKGLSGVHTTGGQLTIVQSSIFANNVGVEADDIIGTGDLIEGSSISKNMSYGIILKGKDGKFKINRSSILNNSNNGVLCNNITLTVSADSFISGNLDPQTMSCGLTN